MTKINTVEMSCLIETAIEVCAFLGIVLEPEISLKQSGDNPAIKGDRNDK